MASQESVASSARRCATSGLLDLSYLEAAFGLLFLLLAAVPMKARRRAAGLLICLVALVLVAVVALVGVPWYFGTHLGLDSGIGG